MRSDRDALVCLRRGMPSEFDDNRIGVCVRCGHEVIYRPHTPVEVLDLVCLVCFDNACVSGELRHTKIAVTQGTIIEARTLGILDTMRRAVRSAQRQARQGKRGKRR